VHQARAMKRTIRQDVKNEAFGFLDLPKVDAKAELDHPLVEKQFMSALEDLLVDPRRRPRAAVPNTFAMPASRLL
jgi:hypothetical protein